MFPTPVGGIALPSELAACIVFLVLYALLVPVVLYRIWNRRSRTFLLLGAYMAVIDRIAFFALRTIAAQRPETRFSDGLLKYSQVTLGLGFIIIGHDTLSLLRCATINPTFGYGEEGRWEESPASKTKGVYLELPREEDEGNPRLRAWLRFYMLFLSFSFLASSVAGIVSLGWFAKKNFGDERIADKLFTLRYASTAVGLFLISVIAFTATWSRWRQHRVYHRAINLTFSLVALTAVVAVYRLSVMHNRIPSLDYTGTGSLNSLAQKAYFYLFHALPEWLAVAILLSFDTRKIFGTGFWGDQKGWDDS